MVDSLQHPDPFLEVRVHDLTCVPGLTGLCVGYELGDWRSEQLAEHLLEWIPEFALTNKERQAIGAHNAVALIAKAARTVYTSPKYKKRGEVGELFEVDPVVQTTVYDQRLAARETHTKGLARLLIDQ